MSETEQKRSMMPHFIAVGLVVVIVLVLYFWFSAEHAEEEIGPALPPPVTQIEPPPQPVIEPVAVPEPEPEPVEVVPEPEPLPTPEPLDTSDATVKTSILTLTEYEAAASLLVNDALIERFVVLTRNLADGENAPQHRLLVPPQQDFRVYTQADKEWIDAATYKRYTPYVDSFEAMDTDSLMQLYEKYKPAIQDTFAEISSPDEDFNDALEKAINHLLDTPEVPVPVEVYSDAVMYKFKDPRLESLSGPQKQLLRTGPENMRRIKAKLRELKALL